MLTEPSRTRFVIILVCVVALALMTGMVAFALEGTPAGVTISNRAEATYEDDAGTMYGVVSSTVSLTIMAVPALVVTPDETAPSNTVSPNERVSRLFRICNTGNVPGSYTITRAEVNTQRPVGGFYR